MYVAACPFHKTLRISIVLRKMPKSPAIWSCFLKFVKRRLLMLYIVEGTYCIYWKKAHAPPFSMDRQV
jgi:hypothetical protein